MNLINEYTVLNYVSFGNLVFSPVVNVIQHFGENIHVPIKKLLLVPEPAQKQCFFYAEVCTKTVLFFHWGESRFPLKKFYNFDYRIAIPLKKS